MSCLPVIIGLFKKKMDGEGRGGWEYINVILSKPTHHTILIKISFRSHHTRLNMVFIIKSTYATRGYHRDGCMFDFCPCPGVLNRTLRD